MHRVFCFTICSHRGDMQPSQRFFCRGLYATTALLLILYAAYLSCLSGLLIWGIIEPYLFSSARLYFTKLISMTALFAHLFKAPVRAPVSTRLWCRVLSLCSRCVARALLALCVFGAIAPTAWADGPQLPSSAVSARVSTKVASQAARRAHSTLRHTRSWATPLAAAAALGWWVHGLWQRRAGHHLTMGSFKTSSSTSFSARSSVSSSPLSPLSEWPEALAVEQELARMTHEEYLSLSSEKWTQRLQKNNVVLADVLSSVDRAALLRNIYIYFMKSQHVFMKSQHVETRVLKVHSKIHHAISAQYLFLHDVARQPSLRLSRQELAIKLRMPIKSLEYLRMRLKRFLTHYPSELGTEGLLRYDAYLYESPGPLTLDQLHERTGRYQEAFLSGDFQLELPLDIKNRIDSYISSQNSRSTFLHNMQRAFARKNGVVAQDGPVRALKYQFVFFTLMTGYSAALSL